MTSTSGPQPLILDYVRTGRGKASDKGGLHHLRPLDLVVCLQRGLVARTGVDPARIEDVVLGVASQVGEQGANLARTANLMADWGPTVPGVTVNRFCASGIDAVAQVGARLRTGEVQLAVAGGVESVSRVPIFSDEGALWRDPEVIRTVGSVHMGIAADLNATVEGWSRQELDAYAVESHTKAARAWADGAFDDCIVELPGRDAGAAFATDELIRSGMTVAGLAALPPAFAEVGAAGQDELVAAIHPEIGPLSHLHTVATSPAMADGAALLLLGTEAAAEESGIRPRGRILASAVCAVDPVVMLTAGQQATEMAIARAGLSPDQIDVFEFAEAFAALCLRFRRDLQAGPDRMNPNGGTIAMGHAFGATGAIMVGGALSELERRGGRFGVAAVSGAAGLGVAVVVERLSG